MVGIKMNVSLKGGYTIESDSNQIILKKLTGTFDKDGNPYKTSVGYYPNITSALNSYVNKSILDSDATEIKQLVEEIKDMNKYIKDMLGGR